MPRGRVGQADKDALEEPERPIEELKPRKRVEHKAYRQSLGSGPPCPDGDHGNLYDWHSQFPVAGRDWYCSHEDHGGNGKFFSLKEVG